MKRRDFIFNALGTAGLVMLTSCNRVPGTKKTIADDSKFVIGNEKQNIKSLFVSNIQGEHFHIEAPCRAHGIVGNPLDKRLVFASSKWGKEAFLADIENKKMVKELIAPIGHEFYGHSLYSKDGAFVFTSMMDKDKDIGYISVRESKTLNEVKIIPSYGRFPHELHWIKQDKVIGIINSAPLIEEPFQLCSIFSLIDISTGNLIKSFRTSTPKHSHFSFTADEQEALVFRASLRGDITLYEKINLKNEKLTINKNPYRFKDDKNEALSHVIIEEKKYAIITIVGMKRVDIWDYQNNKLIGSKNFPDAPQGIGMSKDKKILISFFNEEKSYIKMYSLESLLSLDFNAYATIDSGSGSHLTFI